jgi:hypothetical protein
MLLHDYTTRLGHDSSAAIKIASSIIQLLSKMGMKEVAKKLANNFVETCKVFTPALSVVSTFGPL